MVAGEEKQVKSGQPVVAANLRRVGHHKTDTRDMLLLQSTWTWDDDSGSRDRRGENAGFDPPITCAYLKRQSQGRGPPTFVKCSRWMPREGGFLCSSSFSK